MGQNDLEKSMDTLFGASTSPTVKNIKLLAILMDEKLNDMADLNDTHHTEVLKAIKGLTVKFEAQTKSLDLILFFQDHPKLFWIAAILILVILGLDVKDIIISLL